MKETLLDVWFDKKGNPRFTIKYEKEKIVEIINEEE